MPRAVKYRMTNTCEVTDCDKKPRYGFDGIDEVVRRCRDHREEGMFDRINVRCQFEGCTTQASFGIEHKKPLFCNAHKAEGMINVTKKMCHFAGCLKSISFGYESKKALSCLEHKADDMVDVLHTMCRTEDCGKRASYGYVHQRPIYCSKHGKENQAKDVVSEKCSFPGCEIKPSFGHPGGKAEVCKAHLQQGMSFLGQQCASDDCLKQPCFGVIGGSALFCASHKMDHMIDLRNAYCVTDDCTKTACYGYDLNKRPQYCKYHGQQQNPPAFLVVGKRCENDDCKILANFGFEGMARRFCNSHQLNGMINLSDIRDVCLSCGLEHSLSALSSDRLCLYCRPDGKRYRKEDRVAEYLKIACSEITFERNNYNNTYIRQAFLRYRPDFWVELSDRIIIIEVDEFAHSSREISCEVIRMINIAMACQGKPVQFIRYNPDIKNEDKSLLSASVSSSIYQKFDSILGVIFINYPQTREESLSKLIKDSLSTYS